MFIPTWIIVFGAVALFCLFYTRENVPKGLSTGESAPENFGSQGMITLIDTYDAEADWHDLTVLDLKNMSLYIERIVEGSNTTKWYVLAQKDGIWTVRLNGFVISQGQKKIIHVKDGIVDSTTFKPQEPDEKGKNSFKDLYDSQEIWDKRLKDVMEDTQNFSPVDPHLSTLIQYQYDLRCNKISTSKAG